VKGALNAASTTPSAARVSAGARKAALWTRTASCRHWATAGPRATSNRHRPCQRRAGPRGCRDSILIQQQLGDAILLNLRIVDPRLECELSIMLILFSADTFLFIY